MSKLTEMQSFINTEQNFQKQLDILFEMHLDSQEQSEVKGYGEYLYLRDKTFSLSPFWIFEKVDYLGQVDVKTILGTKEKFDHPLLHDFSPLLKWQNHDFIP